MRSDVAPMNIARLKLFHFPMTRSARVKWLLHEILDDDFDVQKVELYEGEQYRDDFLAINPNHAVPLLEISWESGETSSMIESGAMISWLADVYEDRGLAPAAGSCGRERVDYMQMLHFSASWFDMMLWQLRLHRDLVPPHQRSEAVISTFTTKIEQEVEPQLIARLEKDGFAAGTRFSAVDCILGHNIRWSRFYDLCGHDSFTQYLNRLEERTAYQKAFEDAGSFALKPPSRED